MCPDVGELSQRPSCLTAVGPAEAGKSLGPLVNAGSVCFGIFGLQPSTKDADAGKHEQQPPKAGGSAFTLRPWVMRAEQLQGFTCSRSLIWACIRDLGPKAFTFTLAHAMMLFCTHHHVNTNFQPFLFLFFFFFATTRV